MAEERVYGHNQHMYAYRETGELKERAMICHYYLCTADSFEIGSAYSLHKDEDDARRFHPYDWWRKTSGPESVFVSIETLEEIVKSKDKVVFESHEN